MRGRRFLTVPMRFLENKNSYEAPSFVRGAVLLSLCGRIVSDISAMS